MPNRWKSLKLADRASLSLKINATHSETCLHDEIVFSKNRSFRFDQDMGGVTILETTFEVILHFH